MHHPGMIHRSERDWRGRKDKFRMEELERRALLSAAIQISGNGRVIAFNDTTPATVDFTDFRQMSTTADAAIGTVNRTFRITNTGDVDLHLTGAKVVISGTHASDFTLASPLPDDTVTPGTTNSDTFTINFVPHGTGKRTAKVTVLSDDPAQASFTFSIQGTGVRTSNNSSTHLQIASLIEGAGSPRSAGRVILDYTGFRLDGLVFDSSIFDSVDEPGHDPLTLNVNTASGVITGSVIQGWLQGLQGIEVGETRLLVIPSPLGYGVQPHGADLPPNTPLLFTVTARPQTLVVFSSETITFGDVTPSTTDGTLIGTIAPSSTQSQLTGTYGIGNSGNGVLLFNQKVRVTGSQASNFVVSEIGNLTSSVIGFSVVYKPKKPGSHSAIVHVKSNDPAHPDFTFAVGGVQTPFVDLTATVGTVNFPSSGTITSGASTNFRIPVRVTNNGNVPVPSSTAPIDFQIILHDTVNNTDTLIGSPTTTALRSLGAHSTRTVNLSLPVPIGIAEGTYRVIAQVNTLGALSELSATNNSASGAQTVAVVQGFNNINGTLSTSTVPVSVNASSPIAGVVSVIAQNNGNLTLPAGQKLVLTLMAHDTTDSDLSTGISLGTATVSASSWTVGRSSTFKVNANLPGGLPEGNYQIFALITTAPSLLETSADDNLVQVTALGAPIGLTVT